MLDSRIIPAMGHIKIEKIKPLHLVEFYRNLSQNGIRMDNKCKPKVNSFELLKCTGLTIEEIMKKSGVSDKVIDNIKFCRNINKSSALKICEATKMNFNTLFDAISKPGVLFPQTIRHHHRLTHAIFETAVKE